ncbi:MAG: hypothetical protein FWC32_06625 [Firmicutes bacterium]|nr:hypothetical protein [Bacillota bacterium]
MQKRKCSRLLVLLLAFALVLGAVPPISVDAETAVEKSYEDYAGDGYEYPTCEAVPEEEGSDYPADEPTPEDDKDYVKDYDYDYNYDEEYEMYYEELPVKADESELAANVEILMERITSTPNRPFPQSGSNPDYFRNRRLPTDFARVGTAPGFDPDLTAQQQMDFDTLIRFNNILFGFVVDPCPETRYCPDNFRMVLAMPRHSWVTIEPEGSYCPVHGNMAGVRHMGIMVCESQGFGMLMLPFMAGAEDMMVPDIRISRGGTGTGANSFMPLTHTLGQNLFNNLPEGLRDAFRERYGEDFDAVCIQTYFNAMFRTVRQWPSFKLHRETGRINTQAFPDPAHYRRTYLMAWEISTGIPGIHSAGGMGIANWIPGARPGPGGGISGANASFNWFLTYGQPFYDARHINQSHSIATDGNMDIILGLINADAQWGGGGGGGLDYDMNPLIPGETIGYKYWALGMLEDFWLTVVDHTQEEHLANGWTGNYHLRIGNWSTHQNAYFNDLGVWMSNATRGSDHMFHHLRVFNEVDPKNDWQKVIDASYEAQRQLVLLRYDQERLPWNNNESIGRPGYGGVNGILPDFAVFCRDTNTWQPAPTTGGGWLEGNSDGTYSWNNVRVPWRFGTDLFMSGRNAVDSLVLGSLHSHVNSIWPNFTGIRSMLLDGRGQSPASGTGVGFWSTFTLAALMEGDDVGISGDRQDWANLAWSATRRQAQANNFYADYFKVHSMIVASGNYWSAVPVPVTPLHYNLLTVRGGYGSGLNPTGTHVEITARPVHGMIFAGWVIPDDAGITFINGTTADDPTATITSPNRDVIISATFEEEPEVIPEMRPFPQAGLDTGRVVELFRPTGLSQEDMNNDILRAFARIIIGAPWTLLNPEHPAAPFLSTVEGQFLVDPASISDPENFRMIMFLPQGTGPGGSTATGSRVTVSETHGYGMMMLVQMAGSEDIPFELNGETITIRQLMFDALPEELQEHFGIERVNARLFFDAMFRSLRHWPTHPQHVTGGHHSWGASNANLMANQYRGLPAPNNFRPSYLMAWSILYDVTVDGGNGGFVRGPGPSNATDGCMDMAYALILAHEQWGDFPVWCPVTPDGRVYGYIEWARRMVNDIWLQNVHRSNNNISNSNARPGGGNYHLTVGNWASGNSALLTRTSDFIMQHLKAYKAINPENNWQRVIDTSFGALEFIALYTDPANPTGVINDFVRWDGADGWLIPAQGSGTFGMPDWTPGGQFMESTSDGARHWNACRNPWRLGVDIMFSGTSPVENITTIAYNTFTYEATDGRFRIFGEIPAGQNVVVDGVVGRWLDGTPNLTHPWGSNSWNAFWGPMTVLASIYGPQRWMDEGWSHAVEFAFMNNQYGDYINIFSMLAASGNEWTPVGNPLSIYGGTMIYDIADSRRIVYGARVPLRANSVPGMLFSHWELDGTNFWPGFDRYDRNTFIRMPNNAVAARAIFVDAPVFTWDIFNNGEGGSPSRPNAGLAAAGLIRMWTQLDGVNTPLYLAAADTIEALDQNGNCAEEFVRVGRVWQDGTGWLNYFNLLDVDKDGGSWRYINLTITVHGRAIHVLLVNALYEDAVVPVFSFDIFNNGEGGSPSRPNAGLAAAGIIRMWTQLDGVNAPVYLAAVDTIEAFDQNGNCAEEFVRVGRVWQDGTGWLDYFNLLDVDKDGGSWQYINLYITVYGQRVHVLLVNANFTTQPLPTFYLYVNSVTISNTNRHVSVFVGGTAEGEITFNLLEAAPELVIVARDNLWTPTGLVYGLVVGIRGGVTVTESRVVELEVTRQGITEVLTIQVLTD